MILQVAYPTANITNINSVNIIIQTQPSVKKNQSQRNFLGAEVVATLQTACVQKLKPKITNSLHRLRLLKNM